MSKCVQFKQGTKTHDGLCKTSRVIQKLVVLYIEKYRVQGAMSADEMKSILEPYRCTPHELKFVYLYLKHLYRHLAIGRKCVPVLVHGGGAEFLDNRYMRCMLDLLRCFKDAFLLMSK